MAKPESNFVNMFVTLFLVTLVSAGTLAMVNEVTKAPIAKAKEAKKIRAIKEVAPSFDNNPAEVSNVVKVDLKDEVKPGIFETFNVEIYPAKRGSEIVGYAVKTLTNLGFSGKIDIMVGFKPDGEIVGVKVLSHAETPGLGDKMQPGLAPKVKGKNPASYKLKVTKDGGDLDALTAATISSRAFCDAVDRAYRALNKVTKKNN